jgi:hypothetical protein
VFPLSLDNRHRLRLGNDLLPGMDRHIVRVILINDCACPELVTFATIYYDENPERVEYDLSKLGKMPKCTTCPGQLVCVDGRQDFWFMPDGT